MTPRPHPTPPPILQPPAFTPRQREVIYQIALGLSNYQVGRVLGIAEKTVEAHLARIYAKLPDDDHRSRVGLARIAMAAGWLDP
jgi:DNA-binding NarL/FixJ family response regulator